MSDLGKAIYMAASVFLFIVAASTAIFLYGTLNEYLKISTVGVGVQQRAETEIADGTPKVREATRAEIYITLFNMEQMHVDSLTIKTNRYKDGIKLTRNDVLTGAGDAYNRFMDELESSANKKFTYYCDNLNSVTYTDTKIKINESI